MRKNILIMLIIAAVAIVALGVASLVNFSLGVEERTRERVLAFTPLGTNVDDVIRIVEFENEWGILLIDDFDDEMALSQFLTLPDSSIEGRSFLDEEGVLSGYLTDVTTIEFSKSAVYVNWKFDASGSLIDVLITTVPLR